MTGTQSSVIGNRKWHRPLLPGLVLAAAVLITDYCLPSSGKAETTPPPVKLPPVSLDTRAPQPADDSTVPYPNGALWQTGGEVWKLDDNTAGNAMWSRVEQRALPLDVIGLYVAAAAVNAGGSGYAASDTITLAGGVVITVNTVSSGAVATVTVTAPTMHACAPASLIGVPQQATSGGGSGATFNLTLLYPTAYGTRLLGRCYNGYALRAVRSDSGEARDIGFLADGALDTPNLDAFAQGGLPMALAYTQSDAGLTVPRLSVWYDQGAQNGNPGNNATQATAANRPTIFPGRRLGNARSVMFDAGDSTSWNPAATSMTLPAGVSVTGNNSTIGALSGHVSQYQIATSPVLVGSTAASALAVGISFHDLSTGSEECRTHATASHAAANYIPTDTPQWEKCVNAAAGTTYTNNFQSQALSGGAGSSSAATGGVLGAPGNGRGGSGLIDVAAIIIVPWALDTNTAAMLDAAIYRTFELTPQIGGMIVAGADSHVSGWGAPYQQSWPRQMMELLGRRDIALVNTAKPGQTVTAWGNGSWFLPQTALQGYSGPNKWVILQGGYNDLAAGSTVSQIEGFYATAAANAHAAGAKLACSTDVVRNSTAQRNADVQTLNAYLRANSGGFCDLVIDPAAYAVFNSAAGPWPTPWFEQQDSGIHLSSQGNALWAAIAAQAFKGVLQ